MQAVVRPTSRPGDRVNLAISQAPTWKPVSGTQAVLVRSESVYVPTIRESSWVREDR